VILLSGALFPAFFLCFSKEECFLLDIGSEQNIFFVFCLIFVWRSLKQSFGGGKESWRCGNGEEEKSRCPCGCGQEEGGTRTHGWL